MASSAGIQPIIDYGALADDDARVQALLDLIPNPDSTSSSGATAGGGFLDEISPAAAVQLRVELTALLAAVS